MRFAAARRADPVLDITPMIDIVFQLVLFFMVSTTFISTPGIQVDLPRATADVILNEDEDVNVFMTIEGAIFVNDRPVDSDAALRTLMQRAAERDPDTLVVIKADQGVEHGRVVLVMDIARSEGLTRLAIATDAEGRIGDN